MRMFGIELPSLEEALKWMWESLNLLVEDAVLAFEWMSNKLRKLGGEEI